MNSRLTAFVYQTKSALTNAAIALGGAGAAAISVVYPVVGLGLVGAAVTVVLCLVPVLSLPLFWGALEGRLFFVKDVDLPQGIIYIFAVALMTAALHTYWKGRLSPGLPRWIVPPVVAIVGLLLLLLTGDFTLTTYINQSMLYLAFVAAMLLSAFCWRGGLIIIRRSIIFILAFATLWGLAQVGTGAHRGNSIEDPNYLTHILDVVVVYAILSLTHSKSYWVKGMLLAVAAVMVYYIFLLESRSGLLVAVTLIAVCLALSAHAGRWTTGLITLAIAAVVLNVSSILTSNFLSRFQSADVVTANGRTELWRTAWENIYNRGNLATVLFGFGTGTTEAQVGALTSGATSSVHQNFLLYLQDHGLVGLALLVYLVLKPLQKLYRMNDPEVAFAFIGNLSLLLACFTLVITKDAWFWVMLGLAWGISTRRAT